MIDRDKLSDWIRQALQMLGGTGGVMEVSKLVWDNHKSEIEASKDGLYTWQYDLRWAAQQMRKDGRLKSSGSSERGKWMLTSQS